MILDPRVGIGDITVKQVLSEVVVGFQIRLLHLVADELAVARCQVLLDEFEVFLFLLPRHLIAADSLFDYVHEMHRIGRDFLGIEVERFRQNLVGKPCRDPVHALRHTRRIAIFLDALGVRVRLLKALPVIDAHFRHQRRVLVLLQPRQHGKLSQHFERTGRTRRRNQLARRQQLLIDLLFFGEPQAVGNAHHIDAVEERFVIAVRLETLPFAFVRVRDDGPVVGQRADVLGPHIRSILRRR